MKATCLIENLTGAIKHICGVIATACTQGYSEQLEKPVLPDEVKDSVGSVVESVTLLDGAPIPSWLHYNPETMTFTATDMLRGVTELKVLVTLGGKSWIVNITMQQAP